MSNWKKITTETYNKAPLNLSSDKWYTIAINQDGNASSRFNISSVNNDVTSGFIVFYASTSNDFENQITIISNTIGGQSYPVEKLRIISSGFGAALQIYVTTSTNNLTVRKTGDDSTTSEYKDGWKFINWVEHSNISPDTSENQMLDDEDWESLETTAEIPLKKGNMGLATTGNVYAENIHISDNTTSIHVSASRLLINDELNPHIFSVGLDAGLGFYPEVHIGGTEPGLKTYISSPENGALSSFSSNYPTIGLQFDPGPNPTVYIGNNDHYLGLAYLTDGTPQINIKGNSIKIDGPITHVGGLTTDSIVGSLSGNASTATQLSDGGSITTNPTHSHLLHTGQISNGTVGLFDAINNANSIITLNKHSGDYNSQLGFSSNGKIYYRNFAGQALSTNNATKPWEQILTSANTINATQLDSYNSEAFINETHTEQKAPNDLTPGWYTVAIVPIGRATGRFALRDQQGSARHQSTTFYASHIFGDDKGTQLTVLNNNSYSNIVYTHIRIKEGNTYDGAALQVYVRDTNTLDTDNLEETNHSTRLSVFLLGDNYHSKNNDGSIHEWRLVNWIPDANNPGVSTNINSTTTWANFTSKAEVNLEDFWAGIAVTPGPISGSFIGNGSGLENVCGKRVHLSTTTNGADYPIPFQFGTTTAAGCMDLAKDSANDFTYNPSLNILKVPKINTNTITVATINTDTISVADDITFESEVTFNGNISTPTITAATINTKVLRYQEFSADWQTATTKRYLPLSNAYFNETATNNVYYSRYIFTDDVAVSDVKIEMRIERSMNFKLEVLHHPLGGTLSSGFNQFNSNGFVYNNDTVFEHVLDSGPEGGFNKGDFLYIAIDPIGSGTSNSPGEVNGHLIICYDNKQTLTPGNNTAPNPNPIVSDKE